MLQQLDNEPKPKQHPVLCISHSLTLAEKIYGTTNLEYLAIYWAIHKLSHYVDGCLQLMLTTDHSVLQWLWNVQQSTNTQLYKWGLLLNHLKDKITVVHMPGLMYNNVDPLLRYPVSIFLMLSLGLLEEWHDQFQEAYTEDNFFSAVFKSCQDNSNSQGIYTLINSLIYLEQPHLSTLHLRGQKLYVPQTLVPDVLQLLHEE